MKLSDQLGFKAVNLVTYVALLLLPFMALYNSEWYPASIFAGLLVFFTIFLIIRGESWEKLKWGPTGFEVTRNLRDVVEEGRKIKISREAERQATDTLNKIRKDTTNPRLKFIGLWIETEKKLRELGKVLGLSETEMHSSRYLIRGLMRKEILSKWLLNALDVLRNYRNRVVHGFELSKAENDLGIELAGKILARLDEELRRIQDLEK